MFKCDPGDRILLEANEKEQGGVNITTSFSAHVHISVGGITIGDSSTHSTSHTFINLREVYTRL